MLFMQLEIAKGNLKEKCGEEAYFNFKKLGFKHLGFSQKFWRFAT